MLSFRRLFGELKCAVIGMVHVGALPGTPGNLFSVNKLLENACDEAKLYSDAGVDGIIIENMHDIPYVTPKKMEPEVVSCMTRICAEVKEILPEAMPCGVQVLAAANKQAIAVALASGLDFVRAEGFVYGHIADEGFIDGCAGELLRYRRQIGAEHIQVFADIKKKHSSHSITSDVSIAETAKAAEFFSADGVIVTGSSTGQEANIDELISVKQATNLPVFIGSGVTPENLRRYYGIADSVIVGSYFKVNGSWKNPIDPQRIETFMKTAKL